MMMNETAKTADEAERGVCGDDAISRTERDGEDDVDHDVSSLMSLDYSTTSTESSDSKNPLCLSLPRCLYGRRLGRAYVCLESEDSTGRPRVLWMVGACWPMMLCTLTLILGVPFVLYGLFLNEVHPMLIVCGFALMTITATAFVATACADPGIFPRYTTAKRSNWRWHSATESYRPPGVVYCRDNRLLVERIDHFCPWTGTTIAKRNMLCFQIFTSTLCCLILLTGIITIVATNSMARIE